VSPNVVLVGWSPLWSVPPAEALAGWAIANQAEVRFVFLNEAGSETSGLWPDVTPVPTAPRRLPGSAAGRILRMGRALRSEARRAPASTHVYFDFRALMVGCVLAPRQRKVAYCLDIPPSGLARRLCERAAVARADFVVITESAKADALAVKLDSPRIFEVRNAVPRQVASRMRELRQDSEAIKERFGIPSGVRLAIHAGGLAPEFAVREEMDALAALPDDVVIVFVGRHIGTRGFTPSRARWTGSVTRSEWEQWMAVADVGLAFWSGGGVSRLPLGQWNTPLSWNRLYWYLAAGIPVAAGGHVTLEAFVSETGAGVSTSKVSAKAIGRAIGDVLANATGFEAAARRAYEAGLNYEDQVAGLARAFGL
jgi:hypothetical protein